MTRERHIGKALKIIPPSRSSAKEYLDKSELMAAYLKNAKTGYTRP